jgi:hypothetical protein
MRRRNRAYPRRRKARRSLVLDCGHLIRIGEQELSDDGVRWACLACALAQRAGQQRQLTRQTPA